MPGAPGEVSDPAFGNLQLRPILGLSTEDGVLILADAAYAPEDRFDIQFPVGNSMVRDWGRLDRINNNLAVVHPLTARLAEGRFAATLPKTDEALYIATRDEEDMPVMRPSKFWHDGSLGDWLAVDASEADALARDYAGSGVYVNRQERWEICGILSGLVAQLEGDVAASRGLGFLGLAELARILPDQLPYYLHFEQPLRPDFEFGVPLQPGDLQIWRSGEEARQAPPTGESNASEAEGTPAAEAEAGDEADDDAVDNTEPSDDGR